MKTKVILISKKVCSPCESFQTVITSVYKISHEDIVGVWRGAALSEQLLQVVELSVDVPADGHGAGHRLDVALLQQQVADQLTQLLQLILRQILAILISNCV